MTQTYNDALEWAAKWIEDSLRAETHQRTIEFGKNMAMTLRAARADAPRATGEVGLTVEACLAELREMFPTGYIQIAQGIDRNGGRFFEFRGSNKKRWTPIRTAATLEECFNAVRAWAKSHDGEGEKSDKSK